MAEMKAKVTPFNYRKARKYIGKKLLICLTYYDHKGKLIERKQLHGPIKRINQDEGIVVKVQGRRKLCQFPPDLSCFTKAKKVAYRLKSTGEWVSGLDLITYWKLIKPDPREIKHK